MQKAFQAMNHDTHQYKILGLGVALIMATGLVLLHMHDDEAVGVGVTLRVRDEPLVTVDTSPAQRVVSKSVQDQR